MIDECIKRKVNKKRKKKHNEMYLDDYAKKNNIDININFKYEEEIEYEIKNIGNKSNSNLQYDIHNNNKNTQNFETPKNKTKISKDENVDKENTQITTVDVNDAYMAASTYGVAISYDNNTNKFRAFDVDGHELLINTEKDGKLYIGTEEEYICIYYSNEEKTALEVESKDSKVSINQINHAVQVQMGDFAYSVIGNEVTKFTKEGTASPSTLEELKNAMDEQGLKFESIPELATRYKEELEHDSTSRK